MILVYLDALPLGNTSLKPLTALYPMTVWPTTAPEELASRIKDATIIITNKVRLGAQELRQAPHLKCILVSATGVNNIDLQACADAKILVCNVKDYAAQSVAEQVFAGVLYLRRHLNEYRQRAIHDWASSPVFCAPGSKILDLGGQTLGIIGLGAIGQRVQAIADAFGMRTLIARRDARDARGGRVSWEQLFEESDVISVHCPLTDNTRHGIGEALLARARPGLILVNMARGGIIDEAALARFLEANIMAGAVLDVLEQEPPLAHHPLLSLDNCIVTPHIAWASEGAKEALVHDLALSIEAFLKGQPRSVVFL